MNRLNIQKKKIFVIGISMVLGLVLCACGKEDKWLFSLNGEKLYSKDVAAFTYIYVTEYNIRNSEQLEELYESGMTYGEYHKQQLEEEIIEMVLLYKEAQSNDIKLSKAQKEKIKVNTENVMKRFGEESLEQNNVTESDIENIYKMKYLGQSYMDGFSGDTELDEQLEKERYIQVYQVTFPIVELDENGMVQSDEDGKLKKISLAKIIEMEQAAILFAEQAQSGEDMKVLLDNCTQTVTSIEKYLKYDDLDAEYKNIVDELAVGEVSDVMESDYGYSVICLLDDDAVEYSENVAMHQTDTEMISRQNEEWNRLYSSYAESNKEYKNSELWKSVDLINFLK